MGDPVVQIAKKYPNLKFIVFTGLVKSENVASIFPKQQEATYLLGALAGMLSKNHTIGFIGGDEKYPNLKRIYEGYKQGALDVNSTIKVLVNYLDDWDNETNTSNSIHAAISYVSIHGKFMRVRTYSQFHMLFCCIVNYPFENMFTKYWFQEIRVGF